MLAAVATNRDLRKMVSVSSPLSQLTAHHTNTAQLFSLARFTSSHAAIAVYFGITVVDLEENVWKRQRLVIVWV